MHATDDAQLPRLPTAIRTRRLTLRRVRLSDVDDVLDFATEDVWSRLLRPEASGPFQRRDAERWVASRRLADWRTEPTWAIEFDGRMSEWSAWTLRSGTRALNFATRSRANFEARA